MLRQELVKVRFSDNVGRADQQVQSLCSITDPCLGRYGVLPNSSRRCLHDGKRRRFPCSWDDIHFLDIVSLADDMLGKIAWFGEAA